MQILQQAWNGLIVDPGIAPSLSDDLPARGLQATLAGAKRSNFRLDLVFFNY